MEINESEIILYRKGSYFGSKTFNPLSEWQLENKKTGEKHNIFSFNPAIIGNGATIGIDTEYGPMEILPSANDNFKFVRKK